MNLVIPGVGTEAGPTYASDINASLNIVDQHTHTSGSGVFITPAAININADLSMAGNNLTSTRSVNFQSQVSPLTGAAPDLGCLYESGTDLYFNDGAGNQVRITQSGSVAGSSGTITGLPSGTASASFGASTFVFQAATNTAANIDGGSFILRNNTANSFGLTLAPPNAIGANYQLTLPYIPAQTNVMILDASGNMGSITYDAVGQAMTSVGANAIQTASTRSISATAPNLGVAIGVSTAAFSTTATTPQLIDTISLVTSGRPVMITLIPDGNVSFYSKVGVSYVSGSTLTSTQALFAIFRGGVPIAITTVEGRVDSLNSVYVPPSSISFIDAAPAGINAYQIYISVSVGSSPAGSAHMEYCKFTAYEL